jgi:hypothetical protein
MGAKPGEGGATIRPADDLFVCRRAASPETAIISEDSGNATADGSHTNQQQGRSLTDGEVSTVLQSDLLTARHGVKGPFQINICPQA